MGEITTDKLLMLALLAIPGREHYDSCIPVACNSSVEKNTNMDDPRNPNENNSSPTKKTMPSPKITPRKQAKFSSPRKKSSTRKRKADPCTWKKNVKKRLHITGKAYTSTTGKLVAEKEVQNIDCSKWRFKCSSNISEDKRQHIFKTYWSFGSFERQRDFLCQSILETPCKRGRNTRKGVSRKFMFEVDGTKLRVCKAFYVATLNIGMKTVNYTMKRKKSGCVQENDRSGRHTPANKTSNEEIQRVKRHIESFPTVESHYTRKGSSRLFLAPDINIRKMYELYAQQCRTEQEKPVSEKVYRKTLCESYNMSFHTPKKDQCLKCETYKQKEKRNELTDEQKVEFSQHIESKQRARDEKEADKNKSKQDSSFYTATFDLEAILSTPSCSKVSLAYYKRKLNAYNLSVYSLGNASGSCYMWDESEGGKGSCEISSCLLMHLQSLPSTVNHVTLFSDTCTGQNKNQFVAATLLYAVQTIPNIKVIDQKFLVSGHTQMECDSMHSGIEFAKRNTSIYVPSQWDKVVRIARRRNPYIVIPLKHHNFWDVKKLVKQSCVNFKVDTEGNRVNWMKVKWVRTQKEQQDSIQVKTEFDGDFKTIRVAQKTRGRSSIKIHDLVQMYKARLPISEPKKKDLLSLCTAGVIPSEFHQFYKDLPTIKSRRDTLPLPDVYESDEDTDP